tara:strand:+ start:1730 stop:1870 length:141 start_codon:yes stop_codon:yes gene_type:complete
MKDYIDTYKEEKYGTEEERAKAWKQLAKQAKLDVARAKLKGLIKQG